MSDTRFFPLEQIPKGVAQEIGSHLEGKDLVSVSLASKKTLSFFQKSLQAAKLLHFVKEANYISANKIINTEPLLMFQCARYQNETISPLKLAFKLLDTRMWEMFYDVIKHNAQFVAKFIKQADEQTELVDLKYFVDAYDCFVQAHHSFAMENLTEKQLAQVWLQVGYVQRMVLPRHMLKEFSHKNCTWSPKSEFNDNFSLDDQNTRVYSYQTHHKKPLASAINALGVEFSLKRDCLPSARCVYETIGNALYDRDAFISLYAVRKENRAQFLLQLKANDQNKIECVRSPTPR